ncbi:2-oxoglutarate dehydrogenase E1 component [Aristophania vespae]|uniref:2-oxoglutarate dehydrogenase E1 component n=1 Tax=Aristophania vespae TaxID=2697033 RepID=UPI002351AC62|nr:2-oxoglutarate dehydrogenase E1 component [Aristophania vespae]UMM63778.1 2-oxoglutarate dehydrogenase E1 component [Aristophania vespae]
MSKSPLTGLLNNRDAMNSENVAYLSELHSRWLKDPQSVDRAYATLFSNLGDDNPFTLEDFSDKKPLLRQISDDSLKTAYRTFGHLQAQLDPLNMQIKRGEDALFFPDADPDLQARYRRFYCGTIGAEFMHLLSPQERQWWIDQLESSSASPSLSDEDILAALIAAEEFEAFCQQRYPGVRRFGLEGGESLIVALRSLVNNAALRKVKTISFGMSHRGRLNVMANILHKDLAAIFSEFAGKTFQPPGISVSGDVKYHLGTSTHLTLHDHDIELSLLPNPSHLEAIGPVILGRVRALQDSRKDKERNQHLAVMIHGDAAFAGQGVVYETLQLSQLEGYRTGGTIHFIVNNQIGFTTSQQNAYSGYWNTDVAKSVAAPILHVNGDDAEAVARCTDLAYQWQRQFKRDIVIDIQCYRRNGHNETDDPAFTQPLMVKAIQAQPGVKQRFGQKLIQKGSLTTELLAQKEQSYKNILLNGFDRSASYEFNSHNWFGDGPIDPTRLLDKPERLQPMTGVPLTRLREVGHFLSKIPSDFTLHPRLKRQLESRTQSVNEGSPIDWATAEALAFGTLALDGHPVRLSGQDCGRGTFTQRHAVLTDQNTGRNFTPLAHINHRQAPVDIWNSPLSEYAVLGFEYGYSLGNPEALAAWEAQFGDFSNGAQIIIDQFLASGETKWLHSSGLTLLLPHGYEGAGPEHSSARPERYLQLSAENNLRVCWPSTPANYFHALRRQIIRRCRKPLIIFSPKSLLRNRLTVSSLAEMGPQTRFQPVLADPLITQDADRIIVCSGKVYYDLFQAREEAQKNNDFQSRTALIRIEQLYPFPHHALIEIFQKHPQAREIIWCQEEPHNGGAWQFVNRRIEKVLRTAQHPVKKLDYVGRAASASPATGSLSIHQAEQKALLQKALSLKMS